MKIAGIICEYNPFHLGHLRHIRLTRAQLGEDSSIVCVMSGNYVQRGEPALWDKYTRARAAVACGADIVLELPVTSVLQSAEGFAAGGVEVLDALGCMDVLSFGAECSSIGKLLTLAEKMETPEFHIALRKHLQSGLSYAAACQVALSDDENLLSGANNILGITYCRALLRRNSSMEPLVIHRHGDYRSVVPNTAEPSATAVRALWPTGNWTHYIPQDAAAILSAAPGHTMTAGERAVLARLRGMTDNQWQTIPHSSEGLWSKAMKASRTESSWDAIVQSIKSKRYPRTRVQRMLLCAYLGITEELLSAPISHVRMLALSPVGRSLLHRLRQESRLPLLNPGQAPKNKDLYALETRAADLYSLFSTETPVFRTEQTARWNL